MLEDLASRREIATLTDGLLREAGAYDRFPTPVEDIVAAARLTEPEHSLLSNLILAEAPRYLREAIAPLRRKVKALLDRKEREIHLDPTMENEAQRRFKTCHEVSHDLYPWQSALGFADDDTTLAFTTRILFEQEANQGAAELLFQRERFRQAASDYAVGVASIIELAETFGTSIHATFRRYAETHSSVVSGLVLEPSPCSKEPLAYRRKEAQQSSSWTSRFGPVVAWPTLLRAKPYEFLELAPSALTSLRPPRTTFTLPDLQNVPQEVNVEIFSNTYRLFVLLWLPRREMLKKRRVLTVMGSSA